MNKEIQPRLLRISEVCAVLGMSRSSVYREISASRLSALKIGKSLRVASDDLESFISELKLNKVG